MDRGMDVVRGFVRGLAAGAVGTTALHAVTYADMAVRARPPSRTPEQTIEAAARRLGATVPGDDATRGHRLTGLGALGGIAVGVLAGGALGGLRGLGWRPGPAGSALLATGLALLAGNVPMTLLQVTHPREWSAADWAADVAPHLAYGVTAGATLAALDRP